MLNHYGIFDQVDILCDAGPADQADCANVTVEVHEKKRLNVKGGAYVSQSGEGSMEISTGLNNALGYAEKIDFEIIKGHERSSTYTLAWNQPRVGNSDIDVSTRAFQQVSCSKRLSSFDETNRGISMTAAGGGPATVDYTLVWREIADPTRLASKAVRHQLGHSLKSAVSYTISGDDRDRAVRPTRGHLWRIRSELAGIGADPMMTRFFKQEAEVQAARTLAEGVTFSFSGKLGALLPLGETARKDPRGTCIADRFFLGGVGSLRGFEPHGAGPSDERRPPKDIEAAAAEGYNARDAVGGDFLAVGFAALQLEPTWQKLRDLGIYAHVFANVGTCVPLPTPGTDAAAAAPASSSGAGAVGGAVGDAVRGLDGVVDTLRASIGMGLVFPLPVGNIEVNYVKTLQSQKHDRVKEGLQVGLATAMSI